MRYHATQFMYFESAWMVSCEIMPHARKFWMGIHSFFLVQFLVKNKPFAPVKIVQHQLYFSKQNHYWNLTMQYHATQFMHFESAWMVSCEIMPHALKFWMGIHSFFLVQFLVKNKPLRLWKLCSTNDPLVSSCQEVMNNKHHPHLSRMNRYV